MKTRAEVDLLKKQWLEDPCWDIETAEGFEEYADELIAFREHQEVNWAAKERQGWLMKAVQLGVPNNIDLAKYVLGLESQIDSFARRLQGLEEVCHWHHGNDVIRRIRRSK